MTPGRLSTLLLGVVLGSLVGAPAFSRRVKSPRGVAATQVANQWVEIDYGRPLLRGRRPFRGPDFFARLNDGAPVWRAGANQSTTLRTEAYLRFGKVVLGPGTYTLFIDLRHEGWTLIVSKWQAQERYDQNDRSALFGAFHYRPNRDVVRVPLELDELPYRVEQLTWQFLDITEAEGVLALLWDDRRARVTFEIVATETP